MADPTFDCVNRLIVVDSSTSVIDALVIYSAWKRGVATISQLAGSLVAFDIVGGNPTVAPSSITPYVFILNGWKVRPMISTAFEITGNLLPEVGQSVFSFATGVRPETVRTLALKSETVATGGSSGPTAAQIADAVWAKVLV